MFKVIIGTLFNSPGLDRLWKVIQHIRWSTSEREYKSATKTSNDFIAQRKLIIDQVTSSFDDNNSCFIDYGCCSGKMINYLESKTLRISLIGYDIDYDLIEHNKTNSRKRETYIHSLEEAKKQCQIHNNIILYFGSVFAYMTDSELKELFKKIKLTFSDKKAVYIAITDTCKDNIPYHVSYRGNFAFNRNHKTLASKLNIKILEQFSEKTTRSDRTYIFYQLFGLLD